MLAPSHAAKLSQLPTGAEQIVPAAAGTSAGHALLSPSHCSAASHSMPVAAARHTVAVAATPSGGHSALVPVQLSATSHAPAEARHTNAADRS